MIFRIITILFFTMIGQVHADTLASARQAMDRGAWEDVIHLLQKNQDIESLLLRGEAELAHDLPDSAERDHVIAWEQIQKNPKSARELKVRAAQIFAKTLLAQHRYTEAGARLDEALNNSEGTERAWIILLQGQLEIAQGNIDAARITLLSAKNQGQEAKLDMLVAQAQLALCDLAVSPVYKELEEAANLARKINSPFARTELLLGIAQRARNGVPKDESLKFAHTLTEEITPLIEQPRQRAELLSLRAELREIEKRFADALAISDMAIAQANGASDILFQEEWRRARLYQALADWERALSAYRRAEFHLKTIRANIPIEYQAGHSSFRETLAPFYLGLADLILQQSANLKNDEAQSLLLEARDTVEQLKAAELQDYLRDSCLIEMQAISNLEIISPHTAVLYPILLPERLELLLGIGERQYQITVPVKAEQVRQKAEALSAELRPSNADLGNPAAYAHQMYEWIIAPLESLLTKNVIETLVFVPDGALRLFPLGALMPDDNTYLIERYGIVTAPGLSLFTPVPLARGKVNALIAGMSYPGPVIDELPESLLGELTEDYGIIGISRNIRGLSLSVRGKDVTHLRENMRQLDVRQKIQANLALPGVENEINAIREKMNGYLMMNQDFILNNFTNAMNHPIRVVHIASHGFFGGSPDDSFIMTYDRLLKMGQLETLIQGDQNKDQPIELLTLSACQTAEGNDRAPLGLSGVAIKAGARSAIGSLWPVSDDATQMMISEFYKQLLELHKTKAEALRLAQIKVLREKKFNHPFFWSPFILIGNWL